MKFEIKSYWSGKILFSLETDSLKLCLEAAVKSGADLSSADLCGADLSSAVLSSADLRGAVLSSADLRGADLRGAVLRSADLRGADLRGAVLRSADLRGADLCGADLCGADLCGADLCGADLSSADLSSADLSSADLSSADLCGADLSSADLSSADLSSADLSGAEDGVDLATDEQAIANLDAVREIIVEDTARLEMGHWHANNDWVNRTCAEESVCGTTHCLAGWLQVCATDPKIRNMSAQKAGIFQAPVASKMFYRSSENVMAWLTNREYVKDIQERNERKAARALAKQSGQ